MTYTDRINQLTQQYNDAIRTLEANYKAERAADGWLRQLTGSSLKRQYSARYQALEREYRDNCRQILRSWQQSHPEWARRRRLWSWAFVVGIIALMGSCVFTMPYDDSTPAAQAISQTEMHYWSADDIPMPHLTDGTQYVSNPDQVLTPTAVDEMNATLKRLDDEQGVETAVIVVNHIANDDPFRMAQDVGNKYGVGRNDRGLVIVVGYEDHSINMSPGKALEADLTDAECHRLEQQYVVPAMRAEMPDSGMIYLAQALLSTLQKKELPQMSALTSHSDEVEDAMALTMGIHLLLFVVWVMFFLTLNRKYLWLGLVGSTALLANPFAESEGVYLGGGGMGGGSRGGGGFGGGGFGGGYGGGSFGGGGATSRW